MPQADTPHFDIPFRFEGAAAPTVEQDSYEDVANCVETIIRTPLGFRANTPNFGLPNVLFDVQPIVTDDVTAMIAAQEPRSVLLFTETRDLVDALMDTIMVEVR
jgi:phage baseplate assembly protein W